MVHRGSPAANKPRVRRVRMPTTGGATVSLVGRNFGPELFHGVALDVVRVRWEIPEQKFPSSSTKTLELDHDTMLVYADLMLRDFNLLERFQIRPAAMRDLLW